MNNQFGGHKGMIATAHVLITQRLRKPEHQELLLSGLRIAMGRGLHEPDPLLRAADL
jgi:hypothetical protein